MKAIIFILSTLLIVTGVFFVVSKNAVVPPTEDTAPVSNENNTGTPMPEVQTETQNSATSTAELPEQQTLVGFWECVQPKDPSYKPVDCATGIALDQSDGHMGVSTHLMARTPVEYAPGTKVRVTGIVIPSNEFPAAALYDIDGIIHATVIEEITD